MCAELTQVNMTAGKNRRVGRARAFSRGAIAALTAALLALPAWAAERYRVGPGDSLAISIFGQPDLSSTVKIRENGQIALHILGDFDVRGMSVDEIERMIAARSVETLSTEASVIVEVAQFRDIFVLGEVSQPGAYPFRPGLSVLQAVALAGGFRQLPTSATSDWRLDDAQRRALLARSDLENSEAQIAAIEAELAAMDGRESTPSVVPSNPDVAKAHSDLMSLRRALLDRSVDSARRQGALALQEAESMSKRRELIENQLSVTADQLENIQSLVQKGLARRDQILGLQVNTDKFRADVLEASAFEARARQTAANAESSEEIALAKYRQDLLSDLITAERRLTAARADYRTSLTYIQRNAGVSAATEVAEDYAPIYDLYRKDGDKLTKLTAELATALSPDDILMVGVQSAAVKVGGETN